MEKSRGDCTLLLVDDEEPALELRKLVLQNSGFRVLAASSPNDAGDLFRQNDVDIVVTDHLLGRTTAAFLACEMKRLKPHVPIVSLSGTTGIDEDLKYADEFLSKADGPESLIHALDRIWTERVVEDDSFRSKLRQESSTDIFQAQLLAAIVDDSSDAILSKTLDGTVTTWNRAAEEMYGYTKDEMIGEPVAKLVPLDRPNEVKHILGCLRRGERIAHFETVRVAKSGRPLRFFDNIAYPRWHGQAGGCFHHCPRYQRAEKDRRSSSEIGEACPRRAHGNDHSP